MWYVVQVVGEQEHTVINQILKLVDAKTFNSCFIPQFEIKKRLEGFGNMSKKFYFQDIFSLIPRLRKNLEKN